MGQKLLNQQQNNEVIYLERCPKRSEEVINDLNKAKNAGKLGEALIALCSTYEMDMVIIWKCRDFFIEMSDEFYEKYPTMLSFRTIIEAMAGRLDKASEFVSRLGTTPDDFNGYKIKHLDYVRLMLELVMPQYDNSEFLRRVNFLTTFSQPIRGLALTACRPSVINGFRDVTEFCPRMEDSKDEIIDKIYKIYGNSGKGVYEVALAEWKYETGDSFNALLLLAGIIPSLESERDIRCLFAACVLQIRILAFAGQVKSLAEMFATSRERILNRRYEELEASLEAAVCLYNCYEGNYDVINEWLDNKAPNENKEIFLMDTYSYFVKMRCYLQTGKYMLTLLLSKKMLTYLTQSFRPHDICECHIMSAIACLKAGDKENAYMEFDKALEIGEKHGYIRLFGDEGQAMTELLSIYSIKVSKKEALHIYDSKWIRKIKSTSLEIGNRYKNYLKSEKEQFIKLSKSELAVLQMIAGGLKNDEIALQLSVKPVTVKFHISNIYQKLMVGNRQQAVNRAREVGYLE